MKRRNKRRKLLPLIALLLLAGLVVYLVLSQNVLVVRHVRVEGVQGADFDAIARASSVPFGERMSSVDEGKMIASLNGTGRYELLSVAKELPSTLVLNVRERSQDAVIIQAGTVLLTEKNGTVISVSSEVPETNAIYVTGMGVTGYKVGQVVNAQQRRIDAMEGIITAIDELGARAYVSEINLENMNSLHFYSRTGIRVDLGFEGDYSQKMVWAIGTLRDLEARGEVTGTLDVSSGMRADYRP